MRILIDECVDLTLAQEQFDVLLTIDRGLEFQQNVSKFRISVVVVHVRKNQMARYQVIAKELTSSMSPLVDED